MTNLASTLDATPTSSMKLKESNSVASTSKPNLTEQRRGSASGQPSWTVVIVRDLEQLGSYSDGWQQLAQQAAEPNAFYEPWFLLPAVADLEQSPDWQFLLVFREPLGSCQKRELVGFFPFIKKRGVGGLTKFTLWRNPFVYLTTPLIHAGMVTDVLKTVISWSRDHEGVSFIEFPMLAGEGAIEHSCISIFREMLCTTFSVDCYSRAKLVMPDDVDLFLKANVGGHHFREYGRQRRKLEREGQLEYRRLTDARALPVWVEQFLSLEAKGWKAQAGTAMKQSSDQATFFRDMITRGWDCNRVRLEGLFFKGEPIAMKCNFPVSPGCFAFKIAFDESFRSCSPGVLLEIEHMRRMSEETDIQWIDSCAVSGHQMIERLWPGRRVIHHLVFSTGHSIPNILLGTYPLLRALNRARRRVQNQLVSKLKSQPDSAPTKGRT